MRGLFWLMLIAAVAALAGLALQVFVALVTRD